MSKQEIKVGSVDQTIYFHITKKSDGSPLTGLAFDSVNLQAYYQRDLAIPSSLPLVTQTVTGVHIDGGFVEIDSVNTPGLYRLDVLDGAFITGISNVRIYITELTTNNLDIQVSPAEIQLIEETVSASDISDYIDTNSTLASETTAVLTDTNELQVNQANWLTADISNLDVAVSTRSSHSAVDVATSVWGFIVENSKSAMSHLIRIKSILGGNTQASGTEFMNDAGDTVETTVSIDASGNRDFS